MRNYWRVLPIICLVILFSSLVGCGQSPPSRSTEGSSNPSTAHYSEFIDEIGRKVAINGEPKRIVSLAPNITEILFALKLVPIGVTSYCNYPANTATIEKVGDTLHPNLEQIIALKPDLVLISTASQLEQIAGKLEQLHIAVYVIKSDSLAAVFRSIEDIGKITGHAKQAEQLLSSLKDRMEVIAAHIKGKAAPKIFFVVGTDPLITAGRGAFITDLIQRAGGDSISSDVETEWPAYSMERVVAKAPDMIIFPGNEHGEDLNNSLPAPLKVTPAFKNGKLFAIDGDLVLRPGPRLVDGLERMAKLFHPEAF